MRPGHLLSKTSGSRNHVHPLDGIVNGLRLPRDALALIALLFLGLLDPSLQPLLEAFVIHRCKRRLCARNASFLQRRNLEVLDAGDGDDVEGARRRARIAALEEDEVQDGAGSG